MIVLDEIRDRLPGQRTGTVCKPVDSVYQLLRGPINDFLLREEREHP
jgi:hypothetical protein